MGGADLLKCIGCGFIIFLFDLEFSFNLGVFELKCGIFLLRLNLLVFFVWLWFNIFFMLCRPCFLSFRLRHLCIISIPPPLPPRHTPDPTYMYRLSQPTRGLLWINCPLIYLPMSPIRIRIRFCHTLCFLFRNLFAFFATFSTASLNSELFLFYRFLYPSWLLFSFRPHTLPLPSSLRKRKSTSTYPLSDIISYSLLPSPISISLPCATPLLALGLCRESVLD